MEKKFISRKGFLVNASKITLGAAAGVAGINMLTNNKAYANETSIKDNSWPYPYVALDPEEARLAVHSLYYDDMDCGTGTFGGIVHLLQNAIGDPWTGFPVEIMLFGRGGGVGWGSLCGALNGAAALISLVVEKGPSVELINELWGWYTSTEIPTDAANDANYDVEYIEGPLAQSISGSPLCHPSVSLWCAASGETISSPERKERCGRLAGDVAAKTVQLLNEYFASTFVGTYSDSEQIATCMACHGPDNMDKVMTHMECVSCHPDAHHILAVGEIPKDNRHLLENPYPNPFTQSTTFKFAIPRKEKVRFEIYDLKGKLVYSLIDSDIMKAGTYEVTWRGLDNAGNSLKKGIYFARLTTGNYLKTVKVILNR